MINRMFINLSRLWSCGIIYPLKKSKCNG
jgi:hypothetical protein